MFRINEIDKLKVGEHIELIELIHETLEEMNEGDNFTIDFEGCVKAAAAWSNCKYEMMGVNQGKFIVWRTSPKESEIDDSPI